MENNTIRITPYKVEYSMEDYKGEEVRYMRCFDRESELFRFVSRLYAFDDCFYVKVHSIKWKGATCKYTGWQPGMLFTYVNSRTGKKIWEESFPEWDH